MNKILYVIAITGTPLAIGALHDYRIYVDQEFIMGILAAFLALGVALVAFNLSVQHRNRLTPYLGLAFLINGTVELLHSMFSKGILLSPAGSDENFNALGGVLDQALFSAVMLVGLVQSVKRPGIWSSLPYYSVVATMLTAGLMMALTQVPLPDPVLTGGPGIHRPLELVSCIGYVAFITVALRSRVLGVARESRLARSLVPCMLVLLASQLLLSISATAYQGTVVAAHALTMLAYVLALIPSVMILRRYAEYSFQVAGAQLATLFSIGLLVLSMFSMVQFNRHEREIKNSDEQLLVDLLKKQYRLNQVEYAAQNYMLFADKQYLDDFDAIWVLQQEVIELLRDNIHQSETKALTTRFSELRSTSQKIFAIDAPDEISHRIYVAEQLVSMVNALRKHLERIINRQSRALPASRQQKIAAIHDQLVLELGLLLALILFVVIVSRNHYRRQIQPVIHLNDIAKRITSGQRDIEIGSDRKDELGMLGRSLNAMLKHLRSAVDDLEARVEERTEALRRKEQQLRNIMDNVEEGIVTASRLGIIESVNPAACRMFGYESGELNGSPVYKLIPEQQREAHVSTISRYSDPDNHHPIGFHRRRETGLRSDGTTFALEISVTEVIKEGKRTFIAVMRDITEAQKAEEALRESEQRLARFFDASLEGLLFHDRGRIIDANNAAINLLDRHPLDVVGKNLCEFISPEFRPRLQNILDSHCPDLWESNIKRNDGSQVPVEIQIRDIAFGGSIRSIAVIRDITERKRAQWALDRHNQFTSRILDIVGSLVFVLDASGRIVRFNKACEALTGYSFELIKGEYIWHVMPDINGNQIEQLYRYPAHKDFPNHRRLDWPTARGDIRVIDWINSAFVAEDGTVEYVIAAGVDVTDRLEVEKVLANQLQTLEQKVRERTRELDAMFTLSPDGFVMINEQQQVVYANPAFLEMAGMDPTQVIGIFEQEFCNYLIRLCERQDDNAQNINIDFFKQHNVLCVKRPAERVLSCTVRDIHDERDKGSGMVLYFRDITHETEVDRMKSEFLSTAAHEFRTPLSSILGFSELLLTTNIKEEKRASVTEIIYRQSNYLKGLLDELLDLARIDARAERDFYMTVSSPEPLVNQVIEETRTLAGANHSLKVELPGHWPLVAFDYDKMRQVFTNVLSNAYKYSPDGGDIICSTITRERNRQQQFGLKIQDQGIGMTPEELKRVGERFYRADTSGAIPGTGLGMSLVEEIMKIHNGEIEMTSEKSRGTTVILWLPVAKEQNVLKAG